MTRLQQAGLLPESVSDPARNLQRGDLPIDIAAELAQSADGKPCRRSRDADCPDERTSNAEWHGHTSYVFEIFLQAHRFCEAIEVVFEQMSVPIESDLCRRMTWHSLHRFDARSG